MTLSKLHRHQHTCAHRHDSNGLDGTGSRLAGVGEQETGRGWTWLKYIMSMHENIIRPIIMYN